MKLKSLEQNKKNININKILSFWSNLAPFDSKNLTILMLPFSEAIEIGVR